MKTKTRTIIFLGMVALFIIVAPYLVLSSLGYRFDFEHMKIVSTGGIYVKAGPTGTVITIDGKMTDPKGIFSDAIFVQNLLPKSYGVIITKDGYYSYQKSLLVTEREVTKLENVILFNKTIPFEILENKTQFALLKQKPAERFFIKNNNLYYSAAKENVGLTALEKTTPLIEGIVAFKVVNNNILWLGIDGFLKKSDMEGKNPEVISETPLTINAKNTYLLDVLAGNTFLKIKDAAFIFDQESKSFKSFYPVIKDMKASPDGKKIAFSSVAEVLLYDLTDGVNTIVPLAKSQEIVSDIYWLNNNYIILNTGNTIQITESDYRGNVNSISLPTTITLADNTAITLLKPDIYFDQSNKTLYVLIQNQLVSTNKLLP